MTKNEIDTLYYAIKHQIVEFFDIGMIKEISFSLKDMLKYTGHEDFLELYYNANFADRNLTNMHMEIIKDRLVSWMNRNEDSIQYKIICYGDERLSDDLYHVRLHTPPTIGGIVNSPLVDVDSHE